MIPAEHEAAVMKRFDLWMVRTFGGHQVFTARWQTGPGCIVLDHGRMTLRKSGEAYWLEDVCHGCRMRVASGSSLEKILLEGLQWAVQRVFQQTFIP